MPLNSELDIQKLQAEMNALRLKGEMVTLRQHLDTRYSDFAPVAQRGYSFSLEKYFQENGLDAQNLTVSQMIGSGVDRQLTYLFEEFFLEALYDGLQETDYTDELIAYKVNQTKSGSAVAALISPSDKNPVMSEGEDVPEGAEFGELTVKFGRKSLEHRKFGKKIPLTYEQIADMAISVLAITLKGLSSQIFVDRQVAALKCILNGDSCRDKAGKSLAQSAVKIGVENVAAGLTFKDIDRACMRLGGLGRLTDKMACSEQIQLKISELDEFKKRALGLPLIQTKIKGNYKIPEDRYTYATIPENQLLVFSKGYGIIELTKQALMFETNKIPERQIENTLVSMRCAYMTLFPDSRVIIDESISYEDNPFPAWMKPRV